MIQFVIARLDEMRARLAEGKIDSSDKWMVVRLLERQGSSAAMSQTDIISETVGHMLVISVHYMVFCANATNFRIAGSDTTSISLSFSLWVLSQRRDIMAKLQQEIDQVMPDAGHLPDTNTLHDLPYLNAVIKEGQWDTLLSHHQDMPSVIDADMQAYVCSVPSPAYWSV